MYGAACAIRQTTALLIQDPNLVTWQGSAAIDQFLAAQGL
jgi:hypothetical protein